MAILNLFKKTEYMDFNTYKDHIDFLDDIYFRQRLMKRGMAKT